jgi:hypothetical protein
VSAFWERFFHWKVSPVGKFYYWSLYHPPEFGVLDRNTVSNPPAKLRRTLSKWARNELIVAGR